MFINGNRVQGTLILRGGQHLEEVDPSPEMALEVRYYPRKECAKSGRAHSGECRQGTNACLGSDESGHMVKDLP